MFGVGLFALTLTNTGLALAGTSAISAAGLVAWLFKKDTEIENRRRSAVQASGVLRQLGLTSIPEVLDDYAVGDYSGIAARVRDMAHKLSNPAQLEVEFATVFSKLIDARLNDPQRRDAFLEDVLKRAGVSLPASAAATPGTAA